MQKVDIILATYNGEKYIQELLDSIRSQTFENWQLLVTDDGSTDSTLTILRSYEKFDDRIKIVNTERMGGPLKNFAKGLEFVKGNYVMFSDQDDIWDTCKVSTLVSEIRKHENTLGFDKPIGVFSSLRLISSNGDLIADDYYRYKNLNPLYNTSFKYLLWKCTAPGCVSIFNKAAYGAAMPLPTKISMHDHWLILVTALFGNVFFLDMPTISYRQHDANVIGGQKRSLFYKIINIRRYLHRTKQAALFSLEYLRVINQRFESAILFHYDTNQFVDRLSFVYKCVIPYSDQNRLFLLFFVSYFCFV